MQGRKFCIKHGGKNPIGPANGNWKHGGHSKYMPTRLAEKYRESLEDPQLMEFRADAALLQARLHELLETGESLPLWDQAQDAFRDYRKAAQRAQQAPAGSDERAEAAAQMTEALNRLESLINRGMADSLRWQEVYRVTEQVGKTKEREHRRLVQSEMVYTAEQLLAMVGKIVDAANSTIRDTEDRRAFQAALNQFGLLADRAGTAH
jgi:hypothetical protein